MKNVDAETLGKKRSVVSGHQPNYLPWLGFFDKMWQCDIFVIEDNVQFEQQGFQNRNRVKTVNEVRWLTVPVEHTGRPVLISDVRIANKAEPKWAQRHWLTLKYNYCKARHWKEFCSFFEDTYSRHWTKLIDLNMHLIRGIMKFLKIEKTLVMASILGVPKQGSEKVLAECQVFGCTTHLAGLGARNYLDLDRFREEDVEVKFQDFHHPVYTQLHGSFVPNLSVVDYLFCVGSKKWRRPDGSIGIDEE